MKKLLIIINADYALLSHRIDIALEAQKKGYEVHVACSISEGSLLNDYGFVLHNISLVRSGVNVFHELRLFYQVIRSIERVDPDVLHLVTIKPIFYGGLAVKLFHNIGVIYAVTGLGYVFSSKQLKARLVRMVVEAVYKFVLTYARSVVILQNRSDIDFMVNELGVEADKVIYILGSGVSLSKYVYKPEPTKITVLMASRLLRDKGVYEFVNASKIVSEKDNNVNFVLAGSIDSGNPESINEDELLQLLNGSVVNYIGHSGDISSELSNCNIAVLPSYREGAPRFLIEAAACGRAAISTYAPGCSDIVSNFETGLLVPVSDSISLADAIGFLILNEDIRHSMGKKARCIAQECYSLELVVKEHMRLYSLLCR